MKYVIFQVALMIVACVEVFTLVYYSHRFPHETESLAVISTGVLAFIPGIFAVKQVQKRGGWAVPLLYLGFVNIAAGIGSSFYLASDRHIDSARDLMAKKIQQDLTDTLREPRRRPSDPLPTFEQMKQNDQQLKENRLTAQARSTESLKADGSLEQRAQALVDASKGLLLLLYPDARDREAVEEGLYQRVLATMTEHQAIIDRMKFGQRSGYWMLAVGAALLVAGGGIELATRRNRAAVSIQK